MFSDDLWRRIREKAALGGLLKYYPDKVQDVRYFELSKILRYLESMPVSWANRHGALLMHQYWTYKRYTLPTSVK